MIRALLARNLRRHASLLASLLVAFALLEVLLCVVARQIDMGPGFMTLIEQMLPPGMREFVSSQLGVISFAGAVAFGFQHPVVLAAACAFVIVVGTIPAGERESGLLDLVLAKPVPRTSYLIAVLLQIVLGAIALPLALLAGAIFGLGLVEVPGELPWTRYAPAAAGLSTLLLAVGGFTLFVATGARRRGPAVAWVVGVIMLTFWLDVIAALWSPIESLRWLSPFFYFDPVRVAVLSQASPIDPLVLSGVFLVTTLGAVARFRNQDL